MRTDERHEIEAAMGRLLDGTPLRSDGKLTIVALAVEAGVKRHMLTHKHTDLRDLFYARVKARDGATPNEAALREQNSELRRRLDTLRAERDEYKQAAEALARALNVQTIENGALRLQIDKLRQRVRPTKLTPVT